MPFIHCSLAQDLEALTTESSDPGRPEHVGDGGKPDTGSHVLRQVAFQTATGSTRISEDKPNLPLPEQPPRSRTP